MLNIPKETAQKKILSNSCEEIQTNLCAVTEQSHSSVCGIDVDGLQLNQIVERASTWRINTVDQVTLKRFHYEWPERHHGSLPDITTSEGM